MVNAVTCSLKTLDFMTYLLPLIRVLTPRKGLMPDEREGLLPGAYTVGGKGRYWRLAYGERAQLARFGLVGINKQRCIVSTKAA